jgi:hypothetical protein
VLPNPSNGAIQIVLDTPSEQLTDITIMDLSGRVVHTSKMSANVNTESLNLDLPSGTCLIHLQQGFNIIHVGKIVVID